MSKYFENVDGKVKRKELYPTNMTIPQAFDILVEKVEFALQEMENGNLIRDDYSVCPLCAAKDILSVCKKCPLGPDMDCVDIYDIAADDRRKDGNFRIPNVRRVLNKLKAIRNKMEN